VNSAGQGKVNRHYFPAKKAFLHRAGTPNAAAQGRAAAMVAKHDDASRRVPCSRMLERILSLARVLGKPVNLSWRVRNANTSAAADTWEHFSLRNAEMQKHAPGDKAGPTDASTAMNSDSLSPEEIRFNGADQLRSLGQGGGDPPIGDGKQSKDEVVLLAQLSFWRKAKFACFVSFTQRNDPVYAEQPPRHDFITQPVVTSRTWHHGETRSFEFWHPVDFGTHHRMRSNGRALPRRTECVARSVRRRSTTRC